MASLDDHDAAAGDASDERRAGVVPQLLDIRMSTRPWVRWDLHDDGGHALLSTPQGDSHVLRRWVSTLGGAFGLSMHRLIRERLYRPHGYRGPVAVLSDADILERRAKGELTIEPFAERNLTPNGYDVSIEEIALPSGNLRVREGIARVPPLTRFAVSTKETVALGARLAAQIWLRTTWARRGVLASFGMIDAGFSGTLTFGAFNASEAPLELPIGERFAQIVFLELESDASTTYEKRSGTYQGQRGVTLDRP